MKFETGRFPVQPEKLDQAAAFALRLRKERLVIHYQNVKRENLQPMSGEPVHLHCPGSAIGQIVGIEMALGEVLEIAGQAHVADVTPAQDYPRLREQGGNQPKQKDVVRHLVDDPIGAVSERLEMCQVPVRELPDKARLPTNRE